MKMGSVFYTELHREPCWDKFYLLYTAFPRIAFCYLYHSLLMLTIYAQFKKKKTLKKTIKYKFQLYNNHPDNKQC